MKKFVSAVLAVLCAMCGSALAFEPWDQRIDRPDRDIVILFTNDVHCGVDDSIGYAGLASYRDAELERTPYVTLIDCGDMVQGAVIGAISSGDYIIDIMNAVSYDMAICGNHEFDYGIGRLAQLIKRSTATWLGANISYLGEGRDPLAMIKPYRIADFGRTKVAFIGVTTPATLMSAKPSTFKRDGEFIWSFDSESAKKFYADIQRTVEECRIAGADFVILAAHLGDTNEFSPFSSLDVAANTWGIDAIMDGHAHDTLPSVYVRSKTGRMVAVCSTGTKLTNIGRVVITPDGGVWSGLISGWSERKKSITDLISAQRREYEGVLAQKIASSNVDLSDKDSAGVRIVRSRETGLGDLIADAYRAAGGADIGVANGGSIRTSIKAGDITLGDLLSVNPFDGKIAVRRATGAQILDMLEWGARMVQSRYTDGSVTIGESGGFLQVSNIKYTIDTSVQSTAAYDEHGAFTKVTGARRVSDVQVLRANGWTPIDPKETYTVAGSDFVVIDGGDGNTALLDSEIVEENTATDYIAISEYIRDVLGGDLSRYAKPDGRITIR